MCFAFVSSMSSLLHFRFCIFIRLSSCLFCLMFLRKFFFVCLFLLLHFIVFFSDFVLLFALHYSCTASFCVFFSHFSIKSRFQLMHLFCKMFDRHIFVDFSCLFMHFLDNLLHFSRSCLYYFAVYDLFVLHVSVKNECNNLLRL